MRDSGTSSRSRWVRQPFCRACSLCRRIITVSLGFSFFSQETEGSVSQKTRPPASSRARATAALSSPMRRDLFLVPIVCQFNGIEGKCQ